MIYKHIIYLMHRKLPNPPAWAWVSVLLLVLITITTYAVVWLLSFGKDYIPIASSLIAGAATLTGVGFGALVLRFNYKSQSNPLKVELYKRRCDALCAVNDVAIRIARMPYDKYVSNLTKRLENGSLSEADAYDYESVVAEYDKVIFDLKELIRKHYLILPQDIHDSLWHFMSHCRQISEALKKRKPDQVSRHNERAKPAWARFCDLSRKHIGTDELSASILDIMGGRVHDAPNHKYLSAGLPPNS